MGPHKGNPDDLASLGELDDTILVEELHQRYNRDFIYTYIGDILISINPYKELLRIYGEEIGLRYGKAKTLGELLPHVYALASRAFHNVHRRQGNQCILVSGESGAGKTEITKMVMAQISRLSQWDGEYFLQEKLIEVNPLLEAFGNASTVMNNNSSRFGKLIELIFSEDGNLLGGTITEHMLEKSRVVRQSPGEKNFHIFYNLMCGFTVDERKRYFLEQPEKYRIIDPGHGAPVIANNIDYAGYQEGMDNLRRIMPVVGFTHQDMDVVFALLAAILHLCNIEMAVEPESDQVMVMNEEEIDFASTLLSVKAEDLITVLMANINWVRGERIVFIKSLDQAVDGRDALAKALYSKLFSWIVQQINFMVHEDESRDGERYSISILDMAGFEHFQHNSFEQLCINAANERLQHYFNEHIFAQELQEYQLEGMKQPKIKFNNNDELLNLFFQRPMGIFSLLEEECLLARTTDMSFCEKIVKQYGKHDLFKKSKHREPVFGIVHYAGLVVYSSVGFLDKNRDTLSTNMQNLMENSQNNLVNELFHAKVLNTGTLDMRQGSAKNKWQRPSFQQPEKRQFAPGDSLSRQAGRKIRQKMKEQKMFQDIPFTPNPNSASAHFKNSLQLLMDRLKGCDPQFIRCIKPNNQKLANNFDTLCVNQQLKSTGILETVKIRRLGYAVRLPFNVFITRYQFLSFPLTRPLEPNARNCSIIIKTAKLSDVQIGNTKVFLKYWHTDFLNARLDQYMNRVVHIQASIKSYFARKLFLHHMKMSKQDADEFDGLANYIDHQGQQLCQTIMTQNDHDISRAVKSVHRPSYNNGNYGNGMDSTYMPDVFTASNTYHGDAPGYYQYILKQVLDRYNELDPDVWCKVFYMEYDQPVAKFYVCDKEITVDGSMTEFNGRHIGLGAFNNPNRDEITNRIRSFIGKGIRFNKESDGSITATRFGKNDVVVKGYQDPANHCISADVIMRQGKLPFEHTVKIFDIEEFKSHIGIAMRGENFDKQRLRLLSISGISFIENTDDDLQTPCWLCIINIQALETLSDPAVRKEVQQKFVQMSLIDEGKEEEKQILLDIAERNKNRNWSKLNARHSGQGKKEPLRKSRIQIKQQGQKIQDRMDYSWQDQSFDGESRPKNILELGEEFDQLDDESVFVGPTNRLRFQTNRVDSMASSAMFSDGSRAPRKDWAKVKVTLKQEKTQEGEAIQKAKSIKD
ncbi:hypothetical protein ACF0H5_022588 [Mactra antiquata]